MLTLLPLLGKKVEDLTVNDLSKIRDYLRLDIVVNDELRLAALALIRDEGITEVADLIKSPDSIQKLLSMFTAPTPIPESKHVLQCPHCKLFFID